MNNEEVRLVIAIDKSTRLSAREQDCAEITVTGLHLDDTVQDAIKKTRNSLATVVGDWLGTLKRCGLSAGEVCVELVVDARADKSTDHGNGKAMSIRRIESVRFNENHYVETRIDSKKGRGVEKATAFDFRQRHGNHT